MTMGTTIGEISSAITALLAGKSARFRPMAARVPRKVASSVVATATTMELRKDSCQGSDEKSSWYHCRERPGNGKDRKEPAEKDSGTITRIGRTKNSNTATTMPQ